MSRFKNSHRVVKGGRQREGTPLDRRLASYRKMIKLKGPAQAAAFNQPGSMKKKGK